MRQVKPDAIATNLRAPLGMGNAFTVPNEEVTMGWSSLVSLTEDWVAVDLLQFSYQMRFAITKVTARLLLGVEVHPSAVTQGGAVTVLVALGARLWTIQMS